MIRGPSPPVVAAALSGFVVGVLLTLAASGIFSRSTAPTRPQPTLVPHLMGDAQLYTHVRRLIVRQLGPGLPTKSQARLVALVLKHVPDIPSPLPTQLASQYRSVRFSFRLNDHPLGRAWRLREAKADVFGLLKALYTSRMPIYDVQIEGLFPLDPKRPVHLDPALYVYLSHTTAVQIPWRRWGREKEGALWQRIDRKRVASTFG